MEKHVEEYMQVRSPATDDKMNNALYYEEFITFK